MTPASLGIDLGTSATKVGLYAAGDGRQLALSSQSYDLASPESGWAELDAEEYWRAVGCGVRDVLRRAPSVDVVAMGLSSQGQTFVCLDSDDQPLRPAIAWLDARAHREAAEVRERLGAQAFRRRTGLPEPSAIDSLSKILWLRRHEPTTMERCRRALLLPAFIALRLTSRAVCDPANGASTGMLDRLTGEWWHEALALCTLPAQAMGEVAPARSVAGELTPDAAGALGLAPGIPVAVGTNDQYAGALAVGNREPGRLSGTLGTAMPLLATVEDAAPFEGSGLLLAPHPLGSGWFAMAYTKTAAACLDWLRRILDDTAGTGLLVDEAMALAPGAGGVTCIPHLTGISTPSFDDSVRGGFLGLSLGHGRAHLVRAAMEAVCFSARDSLALLGSVGRDWSEITLTGGATASTDWMSMLADVLGITVRVTDAPEAACRGAALLGLLASGDEGALDWPAGSPQGDVAYQPNPSVAGAYDTAYSGYVQAMDALYPGARRGGS
ncbi:MAG: hypothetical protein GF320_17270 [Armatimonadia bacterium]|nr:hypothetical protein [Armatimonadia bacterium]